VNVKSYLKYY